MMNVNTHQSVYQSQQIDLASIMGLMLLYGMMSVIGKPVSSKNSIYEPSPASNASYRPPKSIKEGLSQSREEEKIASDWYRRRSKQAKSLGDTETADLYEHIAQEEDVHYDEFNNRLNNVGRRSR